MNSFALELQKDMICMYSSNYSLRKQEALFKKSTRVNVGGGPIDRGIAFQENLMKMRDFTKPFHY